MGNENSMGDTPENARTYEQYQAMMESEASGQCPFCRIDFERNEPLNKKGEFDPDSLDWPLLRVWKNPFPQEHHALHLVIVTRRHVTVGLDGKNFSPDEWLQILDVWNWANEFYKIPGGGFVCRFGDAKFNAGTIAHAHCQLQIPDGTGNVKATFFKSRTPEDEERRRERLLPPEQRWSKIAAEAVKLHDEACRHGYPLEVYTFQRPDGQFLQHNFTWGKMPAYWHWHSARHVREVLWRKFGLDVRPRPFFLYLYGEVRPAGPDALNWIDDKEIDFSALVKQD